MNYLDDRPERAGFGDADLTPRARRMAEWLAALVDRKLDLRTRGALGELLLRELPDHWEGDELWRTAQDILRKIGDRQSRCAWLAEMTWLVGEEERLPERPSQEMSELARHRAQQHLRAILGQLSAPQRPRRAVGA
jgi:hypothetical protein